MSGAPRNSDKLNTLAIATIGVCASALVYVSIAMLQAFYANDSADVQTMADYGGQESTAQSLKSAQLGNINEYQMASAANPRCAGERASTAERHPGFTVRRPGTRGRLGHHANRHHATRCAPPSHHHGQRCGAVGPCTLDHLRSRRPHRRFENEKVH